MLHDLHVVSPHPKRGSVLATHAPAQIFCVGRHPASAAAPSWLASVEAPALPSAVPPFPPLPPPPVLPPAPPDPVTELPAPPPLPVCEVESPPPHPMTLPATAKENMGNQTLFVIIY